MKGIYLDCIAGISGNMLLGAFLQIGVSLETLKSELLKLPFTDEYELTVEDTERNGIRAVYAEVVLPGKHHHELEVHHHHGHHHRSWADIRAMIESSSLSAMVKQNSIAIFENLAVAEGKIHGRPKGEVTFHEVGATDSIVDIVGTALCVEFLEIEQVMVSRINTGTGFVKCAHGIIPVPAPATAELLVGFPTYHKGIEMELTTPTGAAVIKTLATYEEHLPDNFKAERIGYGAGSRKIEIPNVLRMYYGDIP